MRSRAEWVKGIIVSIDPRKFSFRKESIVAPNILNDNNNKNDKIKKL